MFETYFPRFAVGLGVGTCMVDLEDKDCLTKVCPIWSEAQDTRVSSSGSLSSTGKVTWSWLVGFTLALWLEE